MDFIKEIKDKLKELKCNDPHYKIFGSSEHKYEMAPPLTREQVHEIEKSNAIVLPSDYVDFLVSVGNGGAGKDYRMYSLEKAIEYGKFDRPFTGVDELLNEAGTKYWLKDRQTLLNHHGNKLQLEFRKHNFEQLETIDLFRKAEELQLNLTENQFYWIYNEITLRDPFDYNNIYLEVDLNLINGYIDVFPHGCGHVASLVVKGKSWGEIIEIGADGQLGKTDMNFTEYYLNWLNESLETLNESKV